MSRHVLHVVLERKSGEWQAWCCCGWESLTWRLKESANVAAETHAASLSNLAATHNPTERGETP